MKVSISGSAFSDPESIIKYYKEEDVPEVGNEFVRSILAHIETLPDHPNIGRKVPEFDDEKIRELVHPPFRIVYLVEQSCIHIIRVWRSERLLVLPESET